MPVREFMDGVDEIVNREDWFGADAQGAVIRFMMSSDYGMSQFYRLYGSTPELFADGPVRYMAVALFDLYAQTGRVIALNPGRRERVQTLRYQHFSKIPNDKEREQTTELFMEWLGEAKRNLHYYGNRQDIDAAVKNSQMMFEHARAELLKQKINEADQTDVPSEFVKAVKNSVQQYQQKVEIMGRTYRIGGYDTARLVHQAYNQINKPIFTLSERLGPIAQVMNSQFIPGGFVCFMGPEKRGKSWWLQEMALCAARQVNTLFIQAGDMSVEMTMRRIATRLLKRGYQDKYCGELFIPVYDCVRNQNNECNKDRRCNQVKLDVPENCTIPEQYLQANPDYQPCAECHRCSDRAWQPVVWWEKRNPVEPHTEEQAIAVFEHMQRNWKGSLTIQEYPSNTLTLTQIESILDMQRLTGNPIKVIVLDYMDLLAAEKSNSRDYRHFQNELWKGFRGLLQKHEMLGIVATQANISAQDCDYIDMQQISEDKRKAAHVTAMWGLNQTKDEKRKGIMRLNQIVVRDDAFDAAQQIVVLQNLATGQPILGSYLLPMRFPRKKPKK